MTDTFMDFLIGLIQSNGGYLIAGTLSEQLLVAFEGIAAGAMLTMIASAMIPEAVLMGTGNLVGLSTLGGFLAAVMFKLFE